MRLQGTYLQHRTRSEKLRRQKHDGRDRFRNKAWRCALRIGWVGSRGVECRQPPHPQSNKRRGAGLDCTGFVPPTSYYRLAEQRAGLACQFCIPGVPQRWFRGGHLGWSRLGGPAEIEEGGRWPRSLQIPVDRCTFLSSCPCPILMLKLAEISKLVKSRTEI